MIDFRTSGEKRRGWWIEERATVPCILPADGQIAVFRKEDVETFMDKTYPMKGKGDHKRWYFNDTYDREIAEPYDDRIMCNPQVLWEHFLKRS